MKKLKVSIITIAYNNEKDISPTIESVLNQTYNPIEYIVVDGASTDNTFKIIQEYKNKIYKIISEPDEGQYDAINKGIRASTGDIVGLIHAGDRLYDELVIQKIAHHFLTNDIDAMYGNSKIVNQQGKIKFINKSPEYSKWMVRFGWMPSHQSIYIKRELFDKIGYYRNDLGGSGDYEFFIRYFYFNNLKIKKLEEYILLFTLGGRSNQGLTSKFKSLIKFKKCWELNGKQASFLMMPVKIVRKVLQFASAYLLKFEKYVI